MNVYNVIYFYANMYNIVYFFINLYNIINIYLIYNINPNLQ